MNNNKTAFVMLGVVGLSLLLAGCGGLLGPRPADAVAIAPGDPAVVTSVDPRLLGAEVIEGEYKDDRLLVGYKDDNQGRAALQTVLALVGDRILDSVDLGDIVIVCIDLKSTLDVPEALGLVMLLVAGKLDALPADPGPEKGSPVPVPVKPASRPRPVEGIVFAEPDYVVPPPEPIPERGGELDTTSLEPKVYDPNADLRPFQWALDAVNADAAWTQATGNGVIVAVMDTGIDSTHPDLVGKVTRRYNCRTYAQVDPTINFDTDNHGTHCAGIIAAKNDGKGVVGLAYNVKLYDVRIFQPGFIGPVAYARGVKWAVDNGAKVLSNSWGGAAYSQAIKAAVDYALVKGAIHVNSAGNDRYDMWRRPASIPGVIAVAASNPHNKAADFTTPGSWVSVTAPGVLVLSSVRSQTIQAGTGLPLYYDYYDGTSMACPYVSALVAMILEKYPTATPYQIKKLLEGTAKDIEGAGFDNKTGYGLIQADKALAAALPANNGAALRVHVVTASSYNLWGNWWPVTHMDITLRRGGRDVVAGQTDLEGRVNLGFPTGDYPGVYNPGEGLGYFPILEPGTYEVLVGGDDCRLFAYRTANRVTGRATVTLTPGGVHTVDVQVNTALQVTLTWTGGGADTVVDLAVNEPLVGWRFASAQGLWGSWTLDQSGPSGTETYTLYAPGEGPYGGHYDDAVYGLAVRFWSGTPATVTVTVRQNTVVENYTFTLTTPGWYHAYTAGPPVSRWPGWWNNFAGPWVF